MTSYVRATPEMRRIKPQVTGFCDVATFAVQYVRIPT